MTTMKQVQEASTPLVREMLEKLQMQLPDVIIEYAATRVKDSALVVRVKLHLVVEVKS